MFLVPRDFLIVSDITLGGQFYSNLIHRTPTGLVQHYSRIDGHGIENVGEQHGAWTYPDKELIQLLNICMISRDTILGCTMRRLDYLLLSSVERPETTVVVKQYINLVLSYRRITLSTQGERLLSFARSTQFMVRCNKKIQVLGGIAIQKDKLGICVYTS